jgi:glycosyltransferase involved in cell wall biosynthesis
MSQGSDRIPAVSIGMPVYNGERFVGRAIASLQAQTFGDFELIISDNASTDGTREICEAAAEEDPRIRYIRQPHNCGMKENFLVVLRQARGELFAWAAHDDIREPEYLSALVDALAQAPDAVLASCRYDAVDGAGRPVRNYDRDWSFIFTRSKTRQLTDMILLHEDDSGKAIHIYGLMRRRALLRATAALSGVDVFSGFDVCVLIDLLFQGEFIFVDRLLLHYRSETAKSLRHDNPDGGRASAVRRACSALRSPGRYYDAHFRRHAEYFSGLRTAINRHRASDVPRWAVLHAVVVTRQVARSAEIMLRLVQPGTER